MKLEFSDIFNDDLKNEIKSIEKAIDTSYNKTEKNYEMYSRNEMGFFITTILSIPLFIIFLITTEINILINVIPLVIGMLSLINLILPDMKINKEKKKVPLIKNNVFQYYVKKRKHLDGKKLNKNIQSLSFNQKEILKYIQKNNLYKASLKDIRKMLIKEKLENTSQSEYEASKEILEGYLEGVSNLKHQGRYKELIKNNFDTKIINKNINMRSKVLENI